MDRRRCGGLRGGRSLGGRLGREALGELLLPGGDELLAGGERGHVRAHHPFLARERFLAGQEIGHALLELLLADGQVALVDLQFLEAGAQFVLPRGELLGALLQAFLALEHRIAARVGRRRQGGQAQRRGRRTGGRGALGDFLDEATQPGRADDDSRLAHVAGKDLAGLVGELAQQVRAKAKFLVGTREGHDQGEPSRSRVVVDVGHREVLVPEVVQISVEGLAGEGRVSDAVQPADDLHAPRRAVVGWKERKLASRRAERPGVRWVGEAFADSLHGRATPLN